VRGGFVATRVPGNTTKKQHTLVCTYFLIKKYPCVTGIDRDAVRRASAHSQPRAVSRLQSRSARRYIWRRYICAGRLTCRLPEDASNRSLTILPTLLLYPGFRREWS